MQKEEQNDKVKENLKLLRTKIDIDLIYKILGFFNCSIESFATQVGVTRSYLSQIFNGKHAITDDLASKVNKALVKYTRSMIRDTNNPETQLLQRAIAFVNAQDPKYESAVKKIREEMSEKIRERTTDYIEKKKKELCSEIYDNTERSINRTIEQIRNNLSEDLV